MLVETPPCDRVEPLETGRVEQFGRRLLKRVEEGLVRLGESGEAFSYILDRLIEPPPFEGGDVGNAQFLPQDLILLSDDQQCERLLDEIVRELLQLGRALMRERHVFDVADLALHVGA